MADERRPIDSTIDELRKVEEFDDEDSQVSVVVHAQPQPAAHRTLVEVIRELPPWGKVIVLVALIAAVTFAGFAGFSLSSAFGK